ncbi:MAG: hypothetical protein ABIT58_04985, partial [Ferruginibacter sp.]
MTKFKNILAALVALVIFSNVTTAQAVKASYSVSAEEPFNVKYIGVDAQYLFFQVSLQNNEAANVKLSINDNKAGEIYSSGYQTNLKVSTVKIERGDLGQQLSFKLVVGNKSYSKSFSVNT